MKITFSRFKQYVDFDWSLEQLAERLTMVGVAIEATEWRKRVAHGVSRGLGVLFGISPEGAAENSALVEAFSKCRGSRDNEAHSSKELEPPHVGCYGGKAFSFAPGGAFSILFRLPTARAVGYSLSPFRG